VEERRSRDEVPAVPVGVGYPVVGLRVITTHLALQSVRMS
jgi:hypothetical protein